MLHKCFDLLCGMDAGEKFQSYWVLQKLGSMLCISTAGSLGVECLEQALS